MDVDSTDEDWSAEVRQVVGDDLLGDTEEIIDDGEAL